MSRVGSVRSVQKMNPGTMSGQSRVAQPFAFAINPKPKRKAAPFVPGLRAWYDASDLSTILSDGSLGVNRVTQFLDKGGRGFHLTPKIVPAGSGGSSAPLTGANTQGGRNVLTFNTGGHHMDYLSHRDKSHFNFLHGNNGCTVFTVWSTLDTTLSTRQIMGTTFFNLGLFQDGDTGWSLVPVPLGGGVTRSTFWIINQAQGGNEQRVAVDSSTGPLGAHISTMIADTANPIPASRGFFYTNAENTSPNLNASTGIAPGARDSASWFSLGGADLGTLNLGVTSSVDGVWSLTGVIDLRFCESRLYEGVLSTVQWQSIRDELNAKWAVY